MKLLFLSLFLPLFTSAQQDFDYALYTRHAQCPLFLEKDSSMTELMLERRIVKEGSRLTITPCMNTANTMEYTIQFQGFHTAKPRPPINRFFFGDTEMLAFEYATEDQKYFISIWPEVPLVEIHEFNTGKLYNRYY